MNLPRVQRFLALAQERLATGQNPERVKSLLLSGLSELNASVPDPFASQIDEFLVEKVGESNEDKTPQEELVEKSAEEKIPEAPQPKPKDESPQEELEEKSDKEGVPDPVEKPEESPQEELEEKAVEEKVSESEQEIEAQARLVFEKVAQEAERRGRPLLAAKFRKYSSVTGEADALNELLQRENRMSRLQQVLTFAFTRNSDAGDLFTKYPTELHRRILGNLIAKSGGVPSVEHSALPIAVTSAKENGPEVGEAIMAATIDVLVEDIAAFRKLSLVVTSEHAEFLTQMEEAKRLYLLGLQKLQKKV